MTLKQFNELCTQAKAVRYPAMPPHAVPPCKYTEKSANELTKAVIAFLQHHGCQAERVSVEGRVIDGRKVVKDVMGVNRTIGSVKRVWASGKKGSADIHSTVPVVVNGNKKIGISLKIEIKWSKSDRQRPEQKEYEQSVNESGGHYVIARTFEQFTEYYFDLIKSYE